MPFAHRFLVLLAAIGFGLIASPAAATQTAVFKSLAQDTIRQAISGSIKDIDALLSQQEQMIRIGLDKCNQHAANSDADGTIVRLVTTHAESMKALSIDEMEEAWLDGGVFAENGIDLEELDHFSPALLCYATVVHSATSYVLLKAYKADGNRARLTRVKHELSELLEHLGEDSEHH